ncbi:maleylpyruvate isomerase family mycothiol-dependent enzyme [Streptoalloteichus hindustanus]|uniref:TIGR03083 family protein n=1 Tax=Streptoalloteichus hindustanus TaxID=2017 RepID=A0A1M5AKW4_STRHI|nr:maleylpyruvate isomerase family mycothiol-dependent enzyme [Streptoalloteichus hindustanus]SHF30532.1 TIGR03083 family protein [Streptoalloteichus hindustanus]
MTFSADRYYAELKGEGARFAETIDGADHGVAVPTCPEWTLAQLAEHVGQAHRWARTIVATRATEMPSRDAVPDAALPEGPAERDAWLRAGAADLVAVIREAGPDAAVWNFSDDPRAIFWARRMTHETLVHRADAALALGRPFQVDVAVAADGLDEWFSLVSLPAMLARRPAVRSERPQSLRFEVTDADGDGPRRWLLNRGQDGVRMERDGAAEAQADVVVRGPAKELLLVVLRRLPVGAPGVEVTGDGSVLDDWLANSAF